MELKATLNKPYTDSQRLDFIVINNRQLGYQIKETETALEAWGLTDEEKQAEEKQARRKELMAELDALDLKEIRPIAAQAAGTATETDLNKLAEIEAQKAQIRAELQNL